MSFRPRNYQDALDYLNRRKYKHEYTRIISREYQRKGAPSQIRDSLVAHTDDPLSTYGDNPPPISFRHWSTNIATFYPDGGVAIDPHYSVTTRERMDCMGLPSCRSPAAMGLTKNQTARLCEPSELFARQELKGFPYGVPVGRATYLLDADKNLHPNEEEPHEDIYVEATPGVHKQYQLGRKRLLKVLKQYADMVEATVGTDPVYFTTADLKYRIRHTCLQCPSLGHLRDEWLPELIAEYGADAATGVYQDTKDKLGLYDLTSDRDLWERKTVNSRDLDQWL